MKKNTDVWRHGQKKHQVSRIAAQKTSYTRWWKVSIKKGNVFSAWIRIPTYPLPAEHRCSAEAIYYDFIDRVNKKFPLNGRSAGNHTGSTYYAGVCAGNKKTPPKRVASTVRFFRTFASLPSDDHFADLGTMVLHQTGSILYPFRSPSKKCAYPRKEPPSIEEGSFSATSVPSAQFRRCLQAQAFAFKRPSAEILVSQKRCNRIDYPSQPVVLFGDIPSVLPFEASFNMAASTMRIALRCPTVSAFEVGLCHACGFHTVDHTANSVPIVIPDRISRPSISLPPVSTPKRAR